MRCSSIRLDNGAHAIVCSGRRGGRVARCVGCGKAAGLLCDWKVKAKRSGTCDAPICSNCTTSPADDKDLCPTHGAAWAERLAGQLPL